MTEKTSVEHLPNMDKKQCNDYDISNTGREKQKFKSISDILEYVSVQEIQRILYSFRDFTNKFETCNNCDCNGERDDVCFECYLDEFEKGNVEILNHWEISNLRKVE